MTNVHTEVDGGLVEAIAAMVHQETKLTPYRNGQFFKTVGDKFEIVGEALIPEPVPFAGPSLTSLVAYAKSETVTALLDKLSGGEVCELNALVCSPNKVELVVPMVGPQRQRLVLMTCTMEKPDFMFGHFRPLEDFVVWVQSRFVSTAEAERVLKFTGGLNAGLAADIEDDGVTQKVTTRKGITRAGSESFKNPVGLAPFRTFTEIDQPVSPFMLRVKQQKDGEDITAVATLIEADGGAWRTEAVAGIGEFLRENMPSDVIVLS